MKVTEEMKWIRSIFRNQPLIRFDLYAILKSYMNWKDKSRFAKFEGKTNEEIAKITRMKIEGCKKTAQNILYFRSKTKLDIPLEEIYKRPPKK